MSTLRTRARGLAAAAGLLLILVGAPAALIMIGATPFPDGVPTPAQAWATLTGVDDGTVILTLLRLAAWAAWTYLALGVVVELTARARGLRAPRIRGLALSQHAAHALVSAVLLALATVPTLTGPAHADTGPVTIATALDAGAGAAPAAATVEPLTPEPPTAQAPPEHTVRPGETLWGIAEQHLGDGARFAEIAELNYHRPQGDGRALTTSHRIHPGWQLLIPTDAATPAPATATSDYTVRAGDTLWGIAVDHLGDGARYPEIYTASTAITQPGGAHLTDPDEIHPGWRLRLPPTQADPTSTTGAEAPVAGGPRPGGPGPAAAQDQDTAAEPADDPAPSSSQRGHAPASPGVASAHEPVADGAVEDEAWPVRTAAGVGSLLAAGVLTLLAGHRLAQSRRRRPGVALPMPVGPSATAVTRLRAVADPFSVTALDTALRTLSAACTAAGRALPVLRYARLTAGQVDLHLEEPAEPLAPWTGAAGGSVWSLTVQDADLLDADAAADTPAPYPALVTLGHDATDAHVLVDLEHAASLSLTGPDHLTRDILAALAVELATSGWADHLQVTVVAAFPELEDALRTGRIRYLPAVGDLLEHLSERARDDRDALTEAGAADLQHARTADAAPEAWTPEIVLLAAPLTPTQHAQLAAFIDAVPRVAVAVVTTGPGPGPWALRLRDEEDLARPGEPHAVLTPTGIDLRPQRLDPTSYRAILDVLALTTTTPTQPYPSRDEPAPQRPHPAPATADTPPQHRHDDADDQGERADPQDHPEPSPTRPTDTGTTTTEASAGEADTPPTAACAVPGAAQDPAAESDGCTGDADLPAPYIRLLGPMGIEHTRSTIRGADKERALELATFLALHPGSTQDAVQEALWPGVPATHNRYAVASRLRSWLGEREPGMPFLPKAGTRGPLRYLPDVRCDWDDWLDLLPDGPLDAPTDDLERALALVRGRPFENAPSKRYAWADTDRAIMTAQVADAAYELARRRAADGNWRSAHEIAIVGVAIDPALERLWRVRIIAAHATDPAAGQDAIDRMLTLAAQLGGDLEPETSAVLTALRTGADPRHLLDQVSTS